MTIEEQLAAKLSPKAIGYHLGLYAELYINPIKTWRKIISPRSSSYDLLILHLIYFTLFIYLIISDLKLTIPIVIAEAAMTSIPWITFVIPFKYFIEKNKKRINATRLFRLLLIIKLQCAPIIVILILFANHTRHDIFYILMDNFIGVYFILWIVSLPLILKLRLRTRLAWIFANYIFFLIIFGLISWIIADFKILEKAYSRNPTSEYLDFKIKSTLSRFVIDDSYSFYMVVFNDKKKLSKIIPHLVSHEILLSFLKKESNYNKKQLFKKDYNLMKSNKLRLYPEKEELTIESAKALKLKVDSVFYRDMSLVRLFKDSTYFPSNKYYFEILFKYFKKYEQNVVDRTLIEKKFRTKTPVGSVKFNDSVFGFLYQDSQQLNGIKSEIKSIEKRFEKRFDYSMFTIEALLFPIIVLAEFKISE